MSLSLGTNAYYILPLTVAEALCSLFRTPSEVRGADVSSSTKEASGLDPWGRGNTVTAFSHRFTPYSAKNVIWYYKNVLGPELRIRRLLLSGE